MRDIDSEANHTGLELHRESEIYQPNQAGPPQSAFTSATLSYCGPRRDVFRYSSNTDYYYSATATGLELADVRDL